MALPTYLELVNDVLTRMREPTVTTVNENNLSKIVAKFVNDSKRQVEDSYDWNAFETTIPVVTVANQGTGYTLVGSGMRFRVTDVINSTKYVQLKPITRSGYDTLTQVATTLQSSDPYYYLFSGVDANGDAKVNLWPIPDNSYVLNFNGIVPSDQLVNNTDTIKVPMEPVILGALARSLVERGEDGGLESSEAFALYKSSLSDHIALEASRSPETDSWIGV